MAGFKSFAEKAELDIENGLTGIVGPNGCGKSNVVESLRWVMGESNARQMRGGEMDDIIFSGTTSRPARSIAEITLQLDNAQRTAPAEFNHHDELEITRKIERGKGSSYLVNGRHARARDVQLLFADTATGARSAGMVSQGRIGAIVGAKPEDRRSLIEEAANIKGLHQRKREAESRLRQTESNLERVQDVITQLAEQRNQLAKQARQAARYSSVADRIRKAEASLLQARWVFALEQRQNAKQDVAEAQRHVDDAAAVVAKKSKEQAEQASSLPALRESEAQAAAELQRLKLELGECDREAERLEQALQSVQAQLTQIDTDASREETLNADAKRALEAVDEEEAELNSYITLTTTQRDEAKATLAPLADASRTADADAAELAAQMRSAMETRQRLENQKSQLEARQARAQAERDSLNLDRLEKDHKQAGHLLADAEQTLTKARNAAQVSEQAASKTQEILQSSQEQRRNADNLLARLTAELDALVYLLAESQPDDRQPVSDSLSVEPGYEAALSACLSSDLLLPYDDGHHGHWRRDITTARLSPPDGSIPITDFVTGSEPISRSLSGVGVVDTDQIGLEKQPSLTAGQILVTKQGHLFRWDGLVRKDSTFQEAERIKQKQRLDVLTVEAGSAQAEFENADKAFEDAQAQAEEAGQAHRQNLNAQAEADQQVNTARRTSEKAQLAFQAATSRFTDLTHSFETAETDLNEVVRELTSISDNEKLTADAEDAQARAEDARAKLTEAVQQEAEFSSQLQTAQQRLASLNSQKAQWQQRLDDTQARRTEMQNRRLQSQAELERLQSQPQIIDKRRTQLADMTDEAETVRQKQADVLRAAEAELTETQNSLRETEREFASLREGLIRAEGRLERCQSDLDALGGHIHEKLKCMPHEVSEITGRTLEDDIPEPIEKLEATLSRLHRERDQIGPVNLRAEVEMAELDERVRSLESECDDLNSAITKLRSAIGSLNKEGRMRLLDSFAAVNGHFTTLFTQLFGGGHAELRLTQSDDPLEAGLEIMASPPGKKLQSLSLLSGGEQALTALAIIFAVFLTNPAPICVLDEVDAPLDDSNVARFCDLLRDIARQTETRFLIVTHHRMTMARMDRLFGVTMEQKGISKLVSVDLQTAEDMGDNLYS